MRYFAEIAYNGSRFKGWQIQPNGTTVQAAVQDALHTVLRVPTEVVGCGRTDAGVHAAQYFLHFDYEGALPNHILTRLNHLAGNDIAFLGLWEMQPEAHARFDAVSRSYYYTIKTQKSPFDRETTYFYPNACYIDTEKMQACAQIFLEFQAFGTFCKTNAQNTTNICTLTHAAWTFEGDTWTFRISSNRFLRGMIRLMVGACLQVGQGKMTLAQVRAALAAQMPLPQPLSAPPEGLFLHDIRYPDALFVKKIS